MRSLMKKAEHSARLEHLRDEALREFENGATVLQQMLTSATTLRDILGQDFQQSVNLLSQMDTAIRMAKEALDDSHEKHVK